ncbi:hypothetical protein M8J76_015046 [Diaphorina citri]|nr:hypothetical protein M8J76_015046 [Diaphorina citri]
MFSILETCAEILAHYVNQNNKYKGKKPKTVHFGDTHTHSNQRRSRFFTKDELKDNALEEEEELKDELGEMGSNISRHSGKGLSGRRTQSSGNLCNGKLVSNVGKLLVPCTKQGDDLTSPNSVYECVKFEEVDINPRRKFVPRSPIRKSSKFPRSVSCATLVGETLVSNVDQEKGLSYNNRYKLCASLPNYLEKENLDELESCKFPYGINNNNNNNNELEFYDLKKDLELNLKPILIKSRTEDYVTNDQGYGSERSPEEEYPPDILNQKNLQDCGGEESSKASDQQICQVHPFINQNSSTFLVCIEKGSRGLGLSVMGGCDTEDHLIRIKRIFPHTPAAQCGVLSQGDVILTVNDVPLTGLTNYEALEVLRMTSHIVHLKVYRPPDVSQSQIPAPPSDPPPPPPKREPNSILVPVAPGDEEDKAREFDIVLTKNNGSLGFTLRKEDESVLGHYVRALVREPALSDGRIKPGDKILAVNGVEMSEMTHEDAVKFLRQCGDDVRLRLYRDATQTPVTALSPSRQHKQIKPILRKEAMDMLSDLAVKKLSPQPSTNSSRSSSPRCRKLKASSDQNNQNHDSRVLSPTRPDSLDFNNGEKKTRYQFSSPESDTDEPDMYTSEHEPTSMPPMGSEHQGFQHGNPSYQSTIPVSSKKSETKLENGGASIPDLPAMLSPPPVEGSKGLLKWKGVVFSPDESEEHMDKIKPPLAFSVSSNGDEQIVVVELNRGWNSRLGFSLNEGPNASTVISAIHSDSVASRDGRLKVNDESVETMSTPDIIDLLRKIRGSICIRVHRKNKAKTSVASNEL